MLISPKTPGVYIDEIPLFPPKVAEVETAIPAFVGYTKRAQRDKEDDLLNRPTKIRSLRQFEQYYGFAPKDKIAVDVEEGGADADFIYRVTQIQVNEPVGKDGLRASYLLYYAMQLFFDNGGGECYVVAVGDLTKIITDADLVAGLQKVAREDEPTLLVVPDAVKLSLASYKKVAAEMLTQSKTLGDRFAILDVFHGFKGIEDDEDAGGGNTDDLITVNRSSWLDALTYGAAYYPFLKTSLTYYLGPADADDMGDNVTVKVGAAGGMMLNTLKSGANVDTALYNTVLKALRESLRRHAAERRHRRRVRGDRHAARRLEGARQRPRSTDVVEPLVKLDNTQQEGLNVDADGGQVDQRHPRLRRQGHARVGRAHARRQRQRVALRLGAPLLQHGRGVGQEVDRTGRCSSRTTRTPG